VFYKLLGVLTWKAIRYYLDNKVPTRKIAAGAILGTVGAVAIRAALKGRDSDT
jgi:hypothetical protein